MPELRTARMEAFARYYAELGHGHGTACAIKAGYSAKSAADMAWRLVNNPYVSARIEELRDAYWQRMQMTPDEVSARLARQSRGADIRKLYDADGNLIEPQKLDEEAAHAVAEYSVDTDPDTGAVKRKVKLRDPTPALRTLAEMAGLIGPKANVQVNVDVHADLASLLDQARLRARTVNAEDVPSQDANSSQSLPATRQK